MLLEALLRMPGAALGSAAHPALAEAAARTCQLALTQMQSKAPSRVAQHHAAVAAPAAVEKQVCSCPAYESFVGGWAGLVCQAAPLT